MNHTQVGININNLEKERERSNSTNFRNFGPKHTENINKKGRKFVTQYGVYVCTFYTYLTHFSVKVVIGGKFLKFENKYII